MLFNLKSAIICGLIAFSAASPLAAIDKRAKIPEVLKCDDKNWSKKEIQDSKSQARVLENSNLAYPKPFGNKDAKGNPVFAAQRPLWEFPLTNPVWRDGRLPDTYRVIMDDNYVFVGVTNKDRGTGGTVHRC